MREDVFLITKSKGIKLGQRQYPSFDIIIEKPITGTGYTTEIPLKMTSFEEQFTKYPQIKSLIENGTLNYLSLIVSLLSGLIILGTKSLESGKILGYMLILVAVVIGILTVLSSQRIYSDHKVCTVYNIDDILIRCGDVGFIFGNVENDRELDVMYINPAKSSDIASIQLAKEKLDPLMNVIQRVGGLIAVKINNSNLDQEEVGYYVDLIMRRQLKAFEEVIFKTFADIFFKNGRLLNEKGVPWDATEEELEALEQWKKENEKSDDEDLSVKQRRKKHGNK